MKKSMQELFSLLLAGTLVVLLIIFAWNLPDWLSDDDEQAEIGVCYTHEEVLPCVECEKPEPVVRSREDLLNEFQAYYNQIKEPMAINSSSVSSLRRLGDLGFRNANMVRDVMKYDRMQENLKAEKETFEKYQELYPDHPYISKDFARKIAERYGMLIAPSDKYKAGIPEENQSDILYFSDLMPEASYAVMAKPDMIDMRGMVVRDQVFVIKDPDPIVFAEVPEGYLFVTAWGDDAMEPVRELDEYLNNYFWVSDAERGDFSATVSGEVIYSDWIPVSITNDTLIITSGWISGDTVRWE